MTGPDVPAEETEDGAVPYEVAPDGATPVRPGAPRRAGRRRWRIAAAGRHRGRPGRPRRGLSLGAARGDPVGPAGASGPGDRPGRCRRQLHRVAAGRQGGDRELVRLPAVEPVQQRARRPGRARTRSTGTRRSTPSARCWPSAPTSSPWWSPPGSPCPSWPTGWASCRATDAGTFRHVATSGEVRSPWQPSGVTSLEGLLATGTYTVLPGETDSQLLTTWWTGSTRRPRRGAGRRCGRARLHAVPGRHHRLHRGEGGGPVQEHGPGGPGGLQPAGPRHALQMDSTVLYALGPGRGDRDRGRPPDHESLQHVPAQGPAPDADLLPVRGTPCRPHCTRPPGRGSTSSWSNRTAPRPSRDTFAGQQANEALARQRGLG